MMFVTDESCERALDFIRDNAGEYGRLRGLCEALSHRRKIEAAQAALESPAATVAARQAEAECSASVRAVVEQLQAAMTDLHTLATQIKAAELRIEVWRSLNSKANRGHV